MPFYILGAVSNSLFISWANSNGTCLIKQFMNHPGNTIMKVCKSTDWNVWTMFLCHQVVCVSKSKAVSSSSPQSSTVVQTCAGLPQTRGGVSQTLAVLQAGPRYQPSFPYKVWNVNVSNINVVYGQVWGLTIIAFLKKYFTQKMQLVSSSEQIWRNLALHHLLTSGSSAVSGCRQNYSPNNPHDSSPSVNIFWIEMLHV